MPLALTELFPDQDYRFHLTLRKGSPEEFFGTPEPAVRAERRHWLADNPARYRVAAPGSAPLVAEAAALVSGWQGGAVAGGPDALVALGGQVEADLVLLARDAGGTFRLQAGVVCFPSWWALTEKVGLTLDEIHGVVPGLNPALAPAIGQFLSKLRPGAPFERANWGLAATPELNLHPALDRPRLGSDAPPARLWVRIEDQLLAAMPATRGILFGIRVRTVPLTALLADPALRAGFHRALVTMPDALADYKGLTPVRAGLIRLTAGG